MITAILYTTGLKRLGLAAALALAAGGAVAGPNPPASGVYDPMMLAFAPDGGTVTGFFQSYSVGNGTEQSPQFTCAFALRGRATAPGRYAIVTWYPGEDPADGATPIKGALTVKDGQAEAVLDQMPGGCQNILAENATGELTLKGRRQWRAVRVVAARRAYFYAKPSARAREKTYVVRGDPLGVVSLRPHWAEADYVRNGRVTHGWVRTGDLFPGRPQGGGD